MITQFAEIADEVESGGCHGLNSRFTPVATICRGSHSFRELLAATTAERLLDQTH
jgi:hypothetical protein